MSVFAKLYDAEGEEFSVRQLGSERKAKAYAKQESASGLVVIDRAGNPRYFVTGGPMGYFYRYSRESFDRQLKS